jgi:hypothetical protein
MDPLIGNGIDSALLRVFEKRGHEREPEMRRRRVPPPLPAEEESNKDESGSDSPKHELDDLA